MGFSGNDGYEWVTTDTYQLITHEVAPQGQVLQCSECHENTTQMDLKGMGYSLKDTTSVVCTQCHNMKTPRGYTKQHDGHVVVFQVAHAEMDRPGGVLAHEGELPAVRGNGDRVRVRNARHAARGSARPIGIDLDRARDDVDIRIELSGEQDGVDVEPAADRGDPLDEQQCPERAGDESSGWLFQSSAACSRRTC